MIKDAQEQDMGLYMIGTSINSQDPLHMLSVKVITRSPSPPSSTIQLTNITSPPNTTAPIDKKVRKLANMTVSACPITMETKGSNHHHNEC